MLLLEDHIASSYPILPNYEMKRSEGIPEFECERVYSHTLIGDEGEVHVIWHDYPTPIYLCLGGYGICIPSGSAPAVTNTTDRIVLACGEYRSVAQQVYGPSGTLSCIHLQPEPGWKNTHLFGGLGAWPEWKSDEGVPPFTPVVIFADGSAHGKAVKPQLAVSQTPCGLKINFEGKDYDIRVIDR